MFCYNDGMQRAGQHIAELQAAILAAFSRAELRQLLKVALDTGFDEIVAEDGFAAQVFDLLLWLDRHGRTLEFFAHAAAANPANPQLARACTLAQALAYGPAFPAGAPHPTYDLAALLGIDWISIPPGACCLGSDLTDDAWAQAAELSRHAVNVAAYQIARCPITNDQYLLFVQAAGHPPPPHWPDGRCPPGKGDHPVVNISWYDAGAFCRWAHVALPTEAQWERAARGGEGRLWPWGDEPPTPLRCNFGLKIANTTPVGLFPTGASPFGVLDLAGNVWEWTSSRWSPYPYVPDDGRADAGLGDPALPDPVPGGLHVVRGGSYDSPARQVRCAARSGINPNYGYDDVGMRVVLYNPGPTISTRE